MLFSILLRNKSINQLFNDKNNIPALQLSLITILCIFSYSVQLSLNLHV
jgi:hypothetical protein